MAFFAIMENFHPDPEYIVRMPDELRIQQRLGQISMNDTTQAELTRIISRRAGDPFDAGNFIGVIADSITEYTRLRLEQRNSEHIEYSEEYIHQEQEKFLVGKMPKFITQLLADDQDRRVVLTYWFGLVYEKIHADEPVDQNMKNDFIQKSIAAELKSDLPRKEKKRRKSLLIQRNGIRPHTTARHNGSH